MTNSDTNPSGILSDALASHGQQNLLNQSTDKLRLYSLNQAKNILGIGITTLHYFIDIGMIGTIHQGKRRKISYMELHRFINENTERKVSSFVPDKFTDRDVEYFTHGKEDKNNSILSVDSQLIFNQLLEEIN